MNCEEFQRDLLNAENPATPADEFEAHLATCAPCREYQGRLVNIEQNVAKLPVPSSTAKEEFIEALLQPESAGRESFIAVLHLPTRPRFSLTTQILLFLASMVILAALIFVGVLLGNWLTSVFKG